MKTVIRKGVFETNSSSTHALAIVRGDEKAPEDMEVSFEVCSAVAKVFMIFGFIENAEYSCEGGKRGWPRKLMLRFKDAALAALAERLGITVKEALEEVECEAFGERAIKDALGDEEKLRRVLKEHRGFAAEFKASKEKDIAAFAERYYQSELERFKTMKDGKYCCDAYFCNGCLIDCYCGFESFGLMVDQFGLDRYDTDESLLEKAREFLSDDVRILCEEMNAGIIPIVTGERY